MCSDDWDEPELPQTQSQPWNAVNTKYNSWEESNNQSQNWRSDDKPMSRGRSRRNFDSGGQLNGDRNFESNRGFRNNRGFKSNENQSYQSNDGNYSGNRGFQNSGNRGYRGNRDYQNSGGNDRNYRGNRGYQNSGGDDRNYRGNRGYQNNSRNYGSDGGYNSSRNGQQWQNNDSSARSHSPDNAQVETESQTTPTGLIDWGAVHTAAIESDKERFGDLPPVVKNLYKEKKEVANMSNKEVSEFRKSKNDITISFLREGSELKIYNPVRSFSDAFGDYPEVMSLIEAQNFKTPSPIQCQLWPILLAGNDVVGIAQTGTGKTLGFLLPGLLHLAAQESFKSGSHNGPYMLVMAPTRELAQQIQEEAVKFRYKGARSVCVYGQGDRRAQAKALRDGIEIVVATPGRLIDFINTETVDTRNVSYLVLDEADRMLDMGFQPDIIKINSHIRPDRQTVLTSATWPSDVDYIAKRLMKDAVKVQVGTLDLAAVSTVTQMVEVCEEDEKTSMLIDYLRNMGEKDKVIVFSNKKAMVDYLSVLLLEEGIETRVMHGGIEQCDRESALEDMRSGEANILLATDVAARGLDVKDITHVVNLDLPRNLEEYVHRSGRTGRAGRKGTVLSFVTWSNRSSAAELIQILQRSSQEIPEGLTRLADRARRYEEKNPKRDFNKRRY